MEPVTTTITTIKAIADIIKGILSITKDVAVKAKTVELYNLILSLQGDIISLQTENSELKQTVTDLKKQNTELREWDLAKQDYETYALNSLSFVVIPKSNIGSPYKSIWFCPNCFENRKKSLINSPERTSHLLIRKCTVCEYSVSYNLPRRNQ